MEAEAAQESPLPIHHTVKRLDFEDIAVHLPMRARALQLRRELERCRDCVSDPNEIINGLKEASAEYADFDTEKLWETYLLLKKEFLHVETQNLFLESYVKIGDFTHEEGTESELNALEKQLADVRSMTMEENEEIKFLAEAFAREIEDFPHLMESTLKYINACDEKIDLLESSEALADHLAEASLLSSNSDTQLEKKVRELSISTGCMELEIAQMDMEISKQEEYLKHIQTLHEVHTRLDLFNKIVSFMGDWTIEACDNNLVTLAFKGPLPKQQKTPQIKQKKQVKEVSYKLCVKVHLETLAVEHAQVEPNGEFAIEDILQEMRFRRAMHLQYPSARSPNDLCFLLRRVGQRAALRKSAA